MNRLVRIFAFCCRGTRIGHRCFMGQAAATGWITLAAVLLLGGCATLWNTHKSAAAVSATQDEMPDDMGRLMDDASRFSGLSESERRSALVREEKRYRQTRTPYNLVRLAMLMTMIDPAGEDTAPVLADLRGYVKERRGDLPHKDMAALAALLSHALEQRSQLLEQNGILQKKLNELKAIEQKLNEQNKRDMIQVPP